MSTNAQRFVDAFAQIETQLRQAAGRAGKRLPRQDERKWLIDSFRSILPAAIEELPLLATYRTNLEQFAQIRNLLVHTRNSRTEHYVQPSDWVTERIELIARQVSQPPLVGALPAGSVSWLSADDLISNALLLMHQHGYSQVPVYREGWTFAGLLTANTVARWLAAAVGDGILELDNVRLVQVLENTENEAHVEFTSRDRTLHSVMQQFQRAGDAGLRLEALIVTDSGKRNAEPRGIITVHDLGRVHQLLSV